MPNVATPQYGAIMPNAPKTTPRQMRIDDETWAQFDAAAHLLDSDRTKLVREYISWLLRRPGVKAPVRLTPEQAAEVNSMKAEG